MPKLTKSDYLYITLNFLLFLPGFLYFVLMPDISIYLYEKLISLRMEIFFLAYFIYMFFLFMTAKIFIVQTKRISIKKEDLLKEKIKKAIYIIFISAYIGFVVNVATVFSFASFSFIGGN